MYHSTNDKPSQRITNEVIIPHCIGTAVWDYQNNKGKEAGGGGKIERQLITTIIFKTNQKVSSCFLNITVPAIFDYEFDTRQLQQVS